MTIVMLLGLLPTAAFAVEDTPEGTATAATPEAITLKSAEYEVGDEVTLNGSTTVSDGGTLSYQWYQSSDDSVDDANAAEDEKNDLPLDGETEATLTVDTSEAGTFYYYVVATNTVTIEDETATASTTSNVVTVTVTAAEPVSPSGSNEPKDGQEPLPPADDGGSATPNNSNPESEGNGETKITEMTLKNFTPFNGETAQDVDLLKQSEPLNWEATGSNTVYTINFTVELEGGVPGKSLRITLPYGMQFVGLVEENGQVTNIVSTTIESVEWEHDVPVYGNSDYQRNNGTLVVHFPDEGATRSSFSINVQPDVAFLPPSQKTEGFLIEDAIQATVQGGDITLEPASVDVKLHSDQQTITSSGIWNQQYTVTPGSANNSFSVTVYWQYLFRPGGGQLYYFIDKATVLFAVPDVFTVTDAKLNNVIHVTEATDVSEELKKKYPNCKFYTATHETFYGAADTLKVTYTVTDQVETDQTYIVYPIYTEVMAYGQSDADRHEFNQNGTIDQLKITVIDPEKTYLDVTARAIAITNYTELGNEAGDFDDYNMLLSYVTIKNQGASAANNLIYETEFDESPGLIRTAIRIPCQANCNEYPTGLTIYYGEGQRIVLNSEQIQSVATKVNASNTYSGIEIQLADVSGLPADAQVTGFKALIPSLVQGYSNSSSYQDRFTSAVIGRVANGVAKNTKYKDKYRIYPASTGNEEIPDYTEVSITVNGTPVTLGADGIVPQIQVNGETQTTAQPGDKIQISNISITPTTWISASQTMLAVDPIFYIIEPAGLNLSSVSFTDGDGNPVYATKTKVNPTNESEIVYGGKLYAYQLNNTLSGYWDGNMETHSIQATVEYNVPYGVQTAAYDLSNLMFWASEIFGTPFNASFPYVEDLYGLNNGKYLGGYKSQTISVTAPQDLAISSAMQIDGTDEWFVYDGTDNSLAVFGNNTTATVRVTIRNNTNGTLNSVEVYVPIPKTGTNLGTNFGLEDGYYFDMYVADSATVPDNWQVQYGVVETAPADNKTAPTSPSGWQNSYNDNTNMVKISMTTENGLPTGEAVDIDLKLRATSDARQNDKRNLFKSWYSYEGASGSGYDASDIINFGALLQIGELTGTVYADSDRDSTKDAGEKGIENVRVTVTDEGGRVYEAMTDENGQYTISGLPSNQKLTVTVYNPYDHESRAGSYRFSTCSASIGETVGSDVTSADSGQTGTITLTSLTGGKGVVNAGLITPYKVMFNGTGNSTVNPSEIYRFPDEAVGLNGQKVTVQTGEGETFQGQWNMSVNDEKAITVADSDLLTTVITGDTVFTPVIESEKNAVYFMVWNDAEGKLVPRAFEDIEYGKPLGSVTDSKFPDMTEYQRPGYTLTGWNVNGVGITIIDNDTAGQSQILNAPVTSMISYHAVYTPLSNITVTLNPNYEGAQSTVMKDQTYGQPINYTIPTREGYTFLGWSTNKAAIEGRMSLTCPATNTTFYAVWKPGTVRLTLLENGGTWADGSDFENGYIDGTVGEAVNLPTDTDITRVGYEFKGWYVQGDAEQKVLSNYAFPTKATTLIAKWEPKQESITFNYGEASQIASETVSGAHGTPVGNDQAQALTGKTYSGYTLTGWTAPDGTVVPAANTGSIVIEDGATYTAIWAQNQTSLVFDAGSGANFPNNGQTKTYYGSAGETLAPGDLIDPVMTGKTFEGWYKETTGGSKVETFTFPNAGSITYYAHWKDAEYTVTFNYNGGKVDDATSSTVKVTHGQMVETVPVPTLIGSTLQGWQNLTNGETMTADQIKEAPVTADVIYNAVWSGNSYTVTFSNYDGDPNSKATVTVTEGAAPVAPVVKAPEGQVFLHWKDNASDNTYTAEALTKLHVKADMDFTAVFGEDSYTITFITSNGSFENMDGATQTTITKQGGEKLAENDFPTVNDNTANFTGWYYNGTTKSAKDWAGTEVNGNMTFVAAFEGKVTVSFNTMGGKWTDEGQQYANGIEGNAGETMTLPKAEHTTRTGYTFTGWYTNMACTDKAPNVFPGSRTTYYAGWSTAGLSVTVTETPTYDGTAKTPALTVMSGTTELTYGADYVAIYEDNVDAGTATVTVYGIGDTYKGLTGTTTFTINKANQTVTFAKPDEQTAIYGESFANTATAELDSANAKITYSSSDTSIATVDTNTGEVTILKAGEVTITATAAGTSNVNEGKAEYKLTISKANPTLTFVNSTVSVKTTGSVSNTLTIVPSGLTVTYSSSDTNVATVDAATGAITLVGEGTATITATFEGNDYYKEAKATYTLTVDNNAIAYTAEGWYGIYDGTPHGITVNVTTPADGATVTYKTTEDGNYSDQKPTYTNAGNYTVYFKIDAKGYDTVTGSAKVIIEKAQLTEATVTGGPYTGQQVGSVSEVKAGVLTDLEKDKDYTVILNNNVNAGENTAQAVIMGTGNFTDTLIKTFTITPKALTKEMVSPIADQPYTGDQITPDVAVEDGTIPLVEGKDFTVTYGNNNTVGTNAGTVTITGIGNYTDKVEVSFNITNSGTFEVIVDNSTLTYDGTEKKPAVTIWAVSNDGSTKTLLTANIDYEVAYEDNTNAGTASVTITGKGAYTESGKSWKDTTAYFTIQPAEQSVTFAGVTDDKAEKTYGDPTFEQAATVTLNPVVGGQTPGTVTYTSSNPAVATVDSDGKVTIVGAGTTTITASAATTQNYKGAEASYTLTVKSKDIGSEDVTASKIPDQPYGGIPVTPEFSLTDSDSDITKRNLEVNVDYTFTYSNNNGEGEGKITIKGTGNYTGIKEVTFQIIPWSESQVVVTPAPITIYMGGADGYEHVIVDEDTGEIKASSSLPEPGFRFTLPEMLKEALDANGETITAVKFYELASGKEWTVAPYAKGSSTVYRLVPGVGQEPVRVQFINAQGETVTEDQFDVGRNVNQELTMTLYKGKVGVINAIYDGVRYPIQLGESTLTVRGVTDEAQYATVTGDATAPVEGKPAVTAESGTSYTINGSDVPVEDASGVVLLFDSIIDANGEDRTSLLEDKAGDALAGMGQTPGEGNRFAYSFQYLDLVDQNNGNAWVKASQDVTIYWPYPAGTNKDTAFTLLHFEGLHRNMAADDIAGQIENCTVSKVSIEDKTETHIVLKVGSAGFSPFALVWEEKIPTPPPVNPNPPADPDDTGVSSLLETKEHIQYLAGYPDNSFGPGRNMTRAEAAQMFYNLLVDKEVKITTAFEDVPENAWYATPVNTLASLGIISGVGDNRFEPDRSITRAEFTALAMKFTVGAEKEENIFNDVKPADWFYEAVTGSIQFGWINGYGDGTFRPNNTITRAEVTAIVNKMLGREGDQAFIQQHQEELKRFTDVTSAHWAYYHIAEATNEHDYTKQGNCEKWSSSSYEK